MSAASNLPDDFGWRAFDAYYGDDRDLCTHGNRPEDCDECAEEA